MKKNVLITAVSFFVLSILLLNACKKDKTISDSMTQTVEDDAVTEKLYDDAFNFAERFGNVSNTKSIDGDSSTCMTITVSGATYPRTVTLDFGTGCEGDNGITRKGKIIIVTSDTFRIKGATRKVSFDNYYVNDYKIEGTKTVTNTGLNSDNKPTRTVVLAGGKVTTPDGKTIERNFSKTRTWTIGFLTPYNLSDDVWEITGTTTGKNINGVDFTATIKTPLVYATTCKYIKSGILEIITESKTMSIDYGNGDCDDIATLTVNGETKQITLRNW